MSTSRRLMSIPAVAAISLALLGYALPARALSGVVTDAQTHAPVAGAIVVTSKYFSRRTDAQGRFEYGADETLVGARAQGYRAARAANAAGGPVRVELQPFRPKSLYLSFFGIGDTAKRRAALHLLATTELNALVIDFKGDLGMLPFKPALPGAEALPVPARVTVRNMPALIAELKAQGIYLIARIVVFKDDHLARAHPELAIRDSKGGPWRDREGLIWVDPFRAAVWDYNIRIAEAAAQMGFDEVQFDYVRFPDARGGPVFSAPSTEQSRVQAITGFLHAAQRKLAPYNVFFSADIFGYVCWNTNDTGIGQHLDFIKDAVDYMAPMLYPSGFTWGIPGQRNPMTDPGKIVRLTLERAISRAKLPSQHFRPWLQSFKDYAFDRRVFGAAEIRGQIDAAEAAGGNGWMLWNPRNQYSAAGLKDDAGRLVPPALVVVAMAQAAPGRPVAVPQQQAAPQRRAASTCDTARTCSPTPLAAATRRSAPTAASSRATPPAASAPRGQ